MDSNLKLILEEFEQLKGQFVITASHKIERLVGIGDDKLDYYWITYDGRKLTWNTCVGGLVPLKGYLREEDYNEFIRLAKLNHFDILDKTSKHIEKITKLKRTDKFLTEICWDLN